VTCILPVRCDAQDTWRPWTLVPVSRSRAYHPAMVESSPSARPTTVAVGIDVAEERKGIDLVALDTNRALLTSAGRLTVEDVARMVLTGIRPSIVCIDSPSGWSHSGKSRAAERELRQFGINAFSTGPDPGPHPFYRWMRVGFSIYEALASTFPLFRGDAPLGTAAEVFPEATAVLLAGRLRNGDESKRAFRGRVLEENGIDSSVLPTVDTIDAALAALTGLLALEGTYTGVGDPAEGVIVLPVAELPRARLERSRAVPSERSKWAPRLVASTSTGRCLCGCGAAVRRRFLPGHDATLKSRLLRAHRAGHATATERLAELGWLKPGA